MSSVLEALGAERLRDSIARQGERLAGQARTGPAPGQVFGLSPNFLVTVPSQGGRLAPARLEPIPPQGSPLPSAPDQAKAVQVTQKKDPAPNKEAGSFFI